MLLSVVVICCCCLLPPFVFLCCPHLLFVIICYCDLLLSSVVVVCFVICCCCLSLCVVCQWWWWWQLSVVVVTFICVGGCWWLSVASSNINTMLIVLFRICGNGQSGWRMKNFRLACQRLKLAYQWRSNTGTCLQSRSMCMMNPRRDLPPTAGRQVASSEVKSKFSSRVLSRQFCV